MSNERAKRAQPTKEQAEEAQAKVMTGLVEGNLKHMLNRVEGFKKVIKERKEDLSRPKVITKETQRQEHEAKELEKFMDFASIFGTYSDGFSCILKEPHFLGRPKEFRYDITHFPDGSEEIRYRNIQILYPLRIILQIYRESKRKIIHATF